MSMQHVQYMLLFSVLVVNSVHLQTSMALHALTLATCSLVLLSVYMEREEENPYRSSWQSGFFKKIFLSLLKAYITLYNKL